MRRLFLRVLRVAIPSCLCVGLTAATGCGSDNTSNPADDGGAGDASLKADVQASTVGSANDAATVDSAPSFQDAQEEPTTDASGDAPREDLMILGTWASNYGGYDEFTNTAWDDATLLEYDNNARVAYTQNPATDPYNPSKFNKIVWTSPLANSLYYCWVDYGLSDLASAKASTKVADPSSPDTSGCGGFGWTKLMRVDPIEIRGTWNSSFGGTETISSRKWSDATLLRFDNVANAAYTQNPSSDPYNPSKFNKLVWTEPSAGSFYYCWVDYGLDTLAAAQASAKTADASQPDTTGCGGFSWTRLSR